MGYCLKGISRRRARWWARRHEGQSHHTFAPRAGQAGGLGALPWAGHQSPCAAALGRPVTPLKRRGMTGVVGALAIHGA